MEQHTNMTMFSDPEFLDASKDELMADGTSLLLWMALLLGYLTTAIATYVVSRTRKTTTPGIPKPLDRPSTSVTIY